ncbi:hypothetical protein Mapa_015507 [Marchantia paleacea]|nr:hypothetical protein Mapa_015507 [Marchantia paleacea]
MTAKEHDFIFLFQVILLECAFVLRGLVIKRLFVLTRDCMKSLKRNFHFSHFIKKSSIPIEDF